ncbi:hypothetical protein [Deinococcus hohokamensis]|uniref:Uncharacterized protein n=1 Tax=Deinococcus hohokamensis TaxID=309883 RepID=A0ABV9I6U2_9DEIO
MQITISAGGYQAMVVINHIRRFHGIQQVTKKTPKEIAAIKRRIAEVATRFDIMSMQEFELSEFGAARYFQIWEADTVLRLRFHQEAEKISLPATQEDIASALFDGVKHRAITWVSVRLIRGWLDRLKQGRYALAPESRQ